MSVRSYFDVWCDGPDPEGCPRGDWCVGATADSAREARAGAKQLGWVYRSGVGDLCPRCQKIIAAAANGPQGTE